MLYYNFIVCIMVCAFLALLNMIFDQEWQYIILPIGILIWGFFKFFDDNDRNYLKSRGIDPDDYSMFDDWFDGGYNNRYNNTPIRRGNTITWENEDYSRHHINASDSFDSNLYKGGTTDYTRYQPRAYQDPRYKGMVKKIKRNFKITVENNSKNEEKPKRTVFFSTHSSNV